MSVDDIAQINRGFGGTTTITGEIDTVIANMAYREGVIDKAAVSARDIAGRHLFNDGNKRTAQAVVERLLKANGSGISSAQIRKVIDQVGTGALRSADDIAAALRGGG